MEREKQKKIERDRQIQEKMLMDQMKSSEEVEPEPAEDNVPYARVSICKNHEGAGRGEENDRPKQSASNLGSVFKKVLAQWRNFRR